MKFFFFLTLFFTVLYSNETIGQTVNDIPISEIDAEYIRIVGISRLLSNKVNVNIEFGQLDKIWVQKDTQVKDENGKVLVLNSMVEALNFMNKYGYEFVQAYAITVSNQNVYHYLMRKRKE